VFLWHGWLSLLVGTHLQAPLGHVATQGITGVSFFFILSGFVLAWSHRPGDTPSAFYQRRIARIVPGYWVACFLGVAVVALVFDRTSRAEVALSFFPVTLLQAWVPHQSAYYAGNTVSWSLSVEAFFYALFPFVIGPILALTVRRQAALLTAVGGLVVAACVAIHPTGYTGARFWLLFIFPAARLCEFVVGICLCALLMSGVRLRIRPSAAGALAIAAFCLAGLLPIDLRLVAAMLIPYSLLIFACAQSDLEGRRSWLHSPMLLQLGAWSYAFYLLHQLVVRLFAWRLLGHPGTALHAIAFGMSYVVAIGAAYLLFRYIEAPLERALRRGGSQALVTSEPTTAPVPETSR
jgi:peptidoglycan/LPS O-acetylase OafA/YrhL